MLTTLGKRSLQPPTMRDMLVDCHTRIRRFCALARRLAEGGPAAEVRDAAAQLHRYFSLALPLHVRDEEQSVRPRLERLGDPSLSAALEAMCAEHVSADVAIGELLETWGALAAEPTEAGCRATQRGAVWIEEHFRRHLHDEEARVFPALDSAAAGAVGRDRRGDARPPSLSARRRGHTVAENARGPAAGR